MKFHNTVDSASNEIASNEFLDLKSWFSSPSVVISLLFMIASKEILVLKSQIFGPLELVRSEINCICTRHRIWHLKRPLQSALWYQMFPWVSEQMSRVSEASEGVSIAKGSAVQQTSEKTSGPFYTMPFSLSQIIVQCPDGGSPLISTSKKFGGPFWGNLFTTKISGAKVIRSWFSLICESLMSGICPH